MLIDRSAVRLVKDTNYVELRPDRSFVAYFALPRFGHASRPVVRMMGRPGAAALFRMATQMHNSTCLDGEGMIRPGGW